MNLKNLCYLGLLTMILFTTSCNDDVDHSSISPDKLPGSTLTFLEKYFPSNSIVSANKYDQNADGSEQLYLTKLTEGILIYFDTKGDWLGIDAPNGLAENGKELIFDKLPSYVGIKEEFNKHYANSKITRLYKEKDDELSFMLDDKVKSYIVYTDEGWTYADMFVAGRYELPKKVQDFIKDLQLGTKATAQYSERYLLRFSGHRGYIYRFVDADNTFIDFYEDGEWFYMANKEKKSIDQAKIKGMLPEGVYTTLKDKFGDAESTITTVAKYNNGLLYGFAYKDKKFALISKDNAIIEPPLDKAKEYINNGFNPQEELTFETRLNTGGAYHLRHAFIARGKNIEIALVTDYEGGMRSISAGPITSSGENIVPLPETILNTMPKTALNYIKEHYTSENPILSIRYNYSKDQNDISDQFYFTVLVPHNLKFIYFDTVTGEFVEEHTAIVEQE